MKVWNSWEVFERGGSGLAAAGVPRGEVEMPQVITGHSHVQRVAPLTLRALRLPYLSLRIGSTTEGHVVDWKG